jgi:hypothetical protein
MADDVTKALVAGELMKAADLGETRSRAELQAAVGIGAGDLDRVLSELRMSGEATEDAPDEWTGAATSTAAPATEHEERPAPVEDQDEPELPGRPRQPGSTLTPADDDDRRVELTMAVAQALDEATLGKLVKAGIDDAREAGVSFEFVVLP